MNKTRNNPQAHKSRKLNILGNIIALLNSKEAYVSSIINLAATCALPVPYTRQIILQLLKNPIIGPHLKAAELQNVNSNEMQKKIRSGEYDSIVWNLNLSDYFDSADEILSLTGIEYNSFKKIFAHGKSAYSTKSVAPEMSIQTKKLLEKIRLLTEQEKEIHFNYRTNAKKSEYIQCKPDRFFTNTTDNLVYLRSTDGRIFLLNNIRECKEKRETSDTTVKSQNDNKTEDYKYLWGPSAQNGETAEDVSLRISKYSNSGKPLNNITRKIKNDLRFREATCEIYEDDRYIYYKDKILGMNNFKRWMRGYGSSIEVIEPQHVRNEILESARMALEFYNRVEEWKDL